MRMPTIDDCDLDRVGVPASHTPDLHAHIAAGTARQPQRFVLAEAESQHAITGAWIAADAAVTVRE